MGLLSKAKREALAQRGVIVERHGTKLRQRGRNRPGSTRRVVKKRRPSVLDSYAA